MKYLLVVWVLVMSGCGDPAIGENPQLSADINFNDGELVAIKSEPVNTTCEIQQVGFNWVIRQSDGFAMAIDQSIQLDVDTWYTIEESDALRVSPLSDDEFMKIQGFI